MPKDNVTKSQHEWFVKSFKWKQVFTKLGFTDFKTYLGKVKKGQKRIYTAPFAGKVPIDKVMDEWESELVSIKDKWPTLYDFEMDLAKKVGPMSVQLPLSKRMDDILHYYEDINLPSTELSASAINAVVREFTQVRGLRMRRRDRTVDKMKKSSNSGAPFWAKRRKVTDETINAVVNWTRDDSVITDFGKNGDYYTPAAPGWRGQEGGPKEDDVKQRVVWMFPYSVNIVELQVYQPLIEACQRFNIVPAWVSMDDVDTTVTRLFDTKGVDDLVVCTDFTKFDQHFNPHMQLAAKTILSHLLARGIDTQFWLTNIFPIKYSIPLIINERLGKIAMLYGRHGMASGSGGTNADETLAHRALQYEAAISFGEKLNTNSMCLGDDGILTYPGITIEQVVEVYKSHGLEMNESKQYASTQDCIYLRRWHHKDYRVDGRCVGVYSTMRAIGRLRYLERWMDPEYWSPEMVALRQLSIIENCKWHPLGEQFIQFCMKRDKYRLGIDIPGFLDNIESKAKEAIDHMPDFLGYTKTMQGDTGAGISNWWVVKYLKSVR